METKDSNVEQVCMSPGTLQYLNDLEDDLDSAIDEIIRLQGRVEALERANEVPDNAFWGQLMFDAFLFIFMVWMIVMVV